MTSATYLDRLAAAVGLGGADRQAPVSAVVLGADELPLHYFDWGGSGPDVLLLHGGGLTAHAWDAVCLALRADARCVALDQRGHGDSGWSPGGAYTVDDHARDIERVVTALGLQQPLLVGHSMGGLNALCAVARLGVPAAGIVLVDIAPGHSLGPADLLIGAVRSEQGPSTLEELRSLAMRFNRLTDPELADAAVEHNLRRSVDGRWTWKHDDAHMKPDLMQRTRASSRRLADELDHVTCPITVVRGARSRILSPEDAEHFAHSRSGIDLITVAGAGHNVGGDQPAQLAAVLRDRLA